MATSTVEPERICQLNDGEASSDGRYVVYWMQASMRSEHNPALEQAIGLANEHGVPLVVVTTIIPGYPEASARHFHFMLGGMGVALRAAERRGATPVVRVGKPVDAVRDLVESATVVVVDRGYLPHQQQWRDELAASAPCRTVCVEGDVVVPVDLVSDKQETAARTIRPRIREHRDRFIVELATTSLDNTATVEVRSDVALDRFDDVSALLEDLGLASDDGPQPVDWLAPGTPAARAKLGEFLDRAADYDDDRNRYASATTSMLSPYLHFGQISPVYVARRIVDRLGDDGEPYLEELIVRRELAVNYVVHCADHGSWSGLPQWARTTLEQHADDARERVYTASELEDGRTDDEVWNAIMAEIRATGWVHNQLRMYWGKQVLRWTNTPQHAYRTLLALNNRWFLDGRDPSSYANVGWCFGLHDQGFQERDVIGKVRPFTRAALKRKDDLDAWLAHHR